MREYALTTLNMIEYFGIYLKKQSPENTRIVSMSHAVYRIRLLYILRSSYQDRRIQNTVKHLRWSE